MLYGGMGQGSETGSKTRGWDRERDGSKTGLLPLAPLAPHGGGDLKFYYGGGDTKIQYIMLYGGKTRG